MKSLLQLVFTLLLVSIVAFVAADHSQLAVVQLENQTKDFLASVSPAFRLEKYSGTGFSLSSPKPTDLEPVDPCETEGIGCSYHTARPRPVGECVNPESDAVRDSCEQQRALAARQITTGVGPDTSAPTISALEYNSSSCIISTSVGSGVCKENASATCPTALRSEGKSCFWSTCPSSCVEPVEVKDVPNLDQKAIDEITREAEENNLQNESSFEGEEYQVASNSSVKTDARIGSVGDTDSTYVNNTVDTDISAQTDTQPSQGSTDGQASTGQTTQVSAQSGATYTSGNQTGGATVSTVAESGVSNSPHTPAVARWWDAQQGDDVSGSYQSLQTNNRDSLTSSFTRPNFLSGITRFVTGQAALRTTPEGYYDGQQHARVPRDTTQQTQPQTIFGIIPIPRGTADDGSRYQDSAQDIRSLAGDIAEPPVRSIARVDHFAQTLNKVSGPRSGGDTENEAFGSIQDLIIKDEAIRALRVAEEEGRRARDLVYCGTNETAESCEQRRNQRAQEVERRVFIEDLERRTLPQSAIDHFLAVYDGWVRPGPAPKTRAVSRIDALDQAPVDEPDDYEVTTDGDNFVLWIIENVANTTTTALDAFVEFFIPGDNT